MMEPITATLTAAKEIYETAKTIQKVYNVSKEMKTVAESEGKDQIMATKDLASTASKMQQENKGGKEGKSESSNKEIKIEGDLYHGDSNNPNLLEGSFVHELDTSHITEGSISEPVGFVEQLPIEETAEKRSEIKNIFVERLSSSDNKTGEVLVEEQTNMLEETSGNEVVEPVTNNPNDVTDPTQETKSEGLTDQEKQEIKEKTGWSDKIVDAIRTKEEAQVYIDAGLVEGEVNGKPALLQPKIDGKACNEPKWPDWNNKDLAEEGYPPRDKKGRPYELHHIGQNPDSPLAELTYEQHHSDGNFKILHTFDESSIDRIQFNKERKEYWSERSKSL
ncbi:HNH/ENDO VII family nuclease [Segatella copri]|nr:HNH/ENDO VII family nuclease [Segatella copri]